MTARHLEAILEDGSAPRSDQLPALRYLGLRGTALSAAELDRLRASLPSYDIDA